MKNIREFQLFFQTGGGGGSGGGGGGNPPASAVSLADVPDNYVATNVESAFTELVTKFVLTANAVPAPSSPVVGQALVVAGTGPLTLATAAKQNAYTFGTQTGAAIASTFAADPKLDIVTLNAAPTFTLSGMALGYTYDFIIIGDSVDRTPSFTGATIKWHEGPPSVFTASKEYWVQFFCKSSSTVTARYSHEL